MYQEIKPSIESKDLIDSFWTFSNNKTVEKFKVLPDACTDLIFDLDRCESFLSGPMSTYQQYELKAQSNLIAIRFKSENFGSLPDFPLNETKNLTIECSSILSRFDFNITDELNSLDTIQKKITRLEVFISTAFYHNLENRDKLIISVAKRIRLLKGKINVEDLARSYHISLRQLQRRFKLYVGLTIKEFANIVRFKNTKKSIKTHSDLSLMQIAFKMGFYGHSHMNYEFNRIAGENPSQFR